ncbi:MAG: hypothetical protein PSV17_08595 [Methylotenera sp.]|uniref:hypothetical protein n=1 Tax=Methylotenera sp. TaxID=2051956 RepID=UPI0024891430|nr:hypothetical protein [Methylotenera sp.]MDI1309476.1 hypothetical protein [Methylotenera sp.]
MSEVWLAQRKMLVTKLKLAQLQLDYEGMKQRGYEVHIPFMEGGVTMTLDERLTLKEAIAVNRQISKKQHEIRLAKK